MIYKECGEIVAIYLHLRLPAQSYGYKTTDLEYTSSAMGIYYE